MYLFEWFGVLLFFLQIFLLTFFWLNLFIVSLFLEILSKLNCFVILICSFFHVITFLRRWFYQLAIKTKVTVCVYGVSGNIQKRNYSRH